MGFWDSTGHSASSKEEDEKNGDQKRDTYKHKAGNGKGETRVLGNPKSTEEQINQCPRSVKSWYSQENSKTIIGLQSRATYGEMNIPLNYFTN